MEIQYKKIQHSPFITLNHNAYKIFKWAIYTYKTFEIKSNYAITRFFNLLAITSQQQVEVITKPGRQNRRYNLKGNGNQNEMCMHSIITSLM